MPNLIFRPLQHWSHNHPLISYSSAGRWRCDGWRLAGGCLRGSSGTNTAGTVATPPLFNWLQVFLGIDVTGAIMVWITITSFHFLDLCDKCINTRAPSLYVMMFELTHLLRQLYSIMGHNHPLQRSYKTSSWCCDGKSLFGRCKGVTGTFGTAPQGIYSNNNKYWPSRHAALSLWYVRLWFVPKLFRCVCSLLAILANTTVRRSILLLRHHHLPLTNTQGMCTH